MEGRVMSLLHLTLLTGASRGLGRALADALLAPDQVLLCIARQPSDALADAARERGTELTQWALDLADAETAAGRLQAWLQVQPGERYASATLINNAAIVPAPGPLEATADGELAQAVRVGLEAPLLLSAAFLRATAHWPGERKLLNVSSGLGRRAMAGSTAYCAVKAGMDHFSRALALEQAALPNGAKVVSLAPGVIDTGMQRTLREADPQRFPEQARFAQLKSQGQLDTPAQAAAKLLAYLRRADFGHEPVADVRG
jgi:NAD(P)-dependent dehydrogenase (short-subunit alcohol dehydrogenase family)